MANCEKRLLLCLLLVLHAADAPAATRGLILLGGLQQSVDFDYTYSGQNASGNSHSNSSSHYFDANYDGAISYALLTPRLLHGNLSTRLGLDHTLYGGSVNLSDSSNQRVAYAIDGAILDRSRTPINFLVRSDYERIQQPFANSYDITYDTYAVSAAMRNKYVPMRLEFREKNSTSSGQINDREQNDTSFAIRAQNKYSISDTDIALRYNNTVSRPKSGNASATPEQSITSYDFSGKNLLSFHDGRIQLATTAGLNEVRRQDQDITRTLNLNENFNWNLGKALDLGASYSFLKSREEGGSSLNTSNTDNAGAVSLKHRLFQSLATTLEARGRESVSANGTESEYSGSANFGYTKKLPEQSMLTINYLELQSITDRNLSLGIISVTDAAPETMTASLVENNLLKNPDVDSSTIVVKDADNPVAPAYIENQDYRIKQVGSFTGFDFNIVGSRIGEGKRLLITYSFNVASRIKYLTASHSLSSSLSMLGGRYQVYGSVSKSTQQDLTSAASDSANNGLTSSLYYTLGGTYSKDEMTVGVQYVNSDSTQLSYQYFEGTFHDSFERFEGRCNVQVLERYTLNDVTSHNPAYAENQLSLSGGYSRELNNNASLVVNSRYFYYTSEISSSRHSLAFETIYQWRIGKIYLNASGKAEWLITNGTTSRDDRLELRLVRQF